MEVRDRLELRHGRWHEPMYQSRLRRPATCCPSKIDSVASTAKWSLFAFGAICIAVSQIVYANGGHFDVGVLGGLFYSCLLLYGVVWIIARGFAILAKNFIGPPSGMMSPISDGHLQRIVKLEVCQGGRTTGRDEGQMWLADGGLYFVGDRTSFAIPLAGASLVNPDLLRRSTTWGCFYRLRTGVRGPGGDCSLKIHLYNRSQDFDFENAFKEMANWKGAAPENAEYPPLEFGPGCDSLRNNLFESFNRLKLFVQEMISHRGPR
ncbi:MAG TPA: hypothetical protein VG944_15705 [Fimbriimonas sp.]|nr:hypothetical protein [Fimbriimonas sp.]